MRCSRVLSWAAFRAFSALSPCYLRSLWSSKTVFTWFFRSESTSTTILPSLASDVGVEIFAVFFLICFGGANTTSCRSCDTLLLLTSRLRSLILICLLRFVYCGKCPKIISFAINYYLRLVASITFVLKYSCGKLRL